MSGLFDELQRRKVYRVAVAYIIAAGGIIQLIGTVFPAWDLPPIAQRLTIVILLICFPIALILAWVFDVTPEGIKTTPTPEAKSQRRNIAAVVAGSVVISSAAGFFLLPSAVAHKVDKSIAVLPFESLSDDKENAYFADGVQDDILTNLSKIGDLKVISRTSVMPYRNKTKNIREIGKALGVANVLEGSVRRYGNKVRVNVQLIDATSDKHLWAEDYDGDLTDVFKIQTELAHQIATHLKAELSPSEKARMENKPTQNGDAYLEFMRAHDLQSSSYEDLDKLKLGEQRYEKAIKLDPDFALAYARYSQLESWIVHSWERNQGRREKARTLAERAIELQPDLSEAHLALGFVDYYIDNHFAAAEREFEIARQGLPNDSEVYLALGAIQRRQGKWTESNASLEKAVSLNPKDIWAMQNLAINYEMQRNWELARQTIDKALAVDPNSLGPLEIQAKIALEENGDLETGRKLLEKFDTMSLNPDVQSKVNGERVNFYILSRDFKTAAEFADKLPDSSLASFPGALCGKYTAIGAAHKALHDDAGAREALLKAKSFVEGDIKENSDDAAAHAHLAATLAWLGEKDAALVEIQRAQTLLPESKDAFDGPDITRTAAEIYSIFGDAGNAVPLLDGLLQRPSTVTVALLKLNPIWDFIRNDPQFQALLAKHDKP